MHVSRETPGRELFLVIEGLTAQLDSLLARLRPLSQAPEAGLLLGVDALYRADKDLALLCLRLRGSASVSERRQLIRLSRDGSIPVLDPLRLNDDDRALFYQRHLRRYAVRIDDKNCPNAAIDALGQLLGLIEFRGQSDSGVADPADEEITKVGSGRLGTGGRSRRDREIVLELPFAMAAGSESDADAAPSTIEEPHDEEGYDEDVRTMEALPPEPPPLNLLSMDLGPAGKAPSPRSPVVETAPAVGRPAGKGRSHERKPTIPGRPAHSLALPPSDAARPLPRTPRASNTPYPATGGDDGVLVRFKRGDQWMPARLRNLTLKQVRLAASAAPPVGTALRVFISLGGHDVSLPGSVVEVINTESSEDGSTSFRVDLKDLANHELERLTTLLRQARSQGLQLSRPPARRNRRFAVSWPVAVLSDGERFNAAALDISEQGLFLATSNLIRANRVVFGMALDTPESAIRGRARIAREVTEEMATERHLSRGYGLQIEALGSDDIERYAKFLVRVRSRSQLHVLVAGRSMRSQELTNCFAAAGYAVTQAASLEKLEQQGGLEGGRTDVAVLDKTDLSRDLRAQFEHQFDAYNVPMLHLAGQAPTSARHALDQLLSV